ncbi:exosortase-associated protein EpsI, V-type [Parasphingorhabdus cellanae]|uniref:EpsI family protein n=1 Tax=Parasphingorhabdus cellanae TaxID=2806553 RepID=A0ABX7T3T7_9SPHN|nr:exosortase-associated protein EpsI, V-type [Parasphingorhabdus cellanae]QTD56239.1 EpsI family protein [Parasphingorhabdus cellanae]
MNAESQSDVIAGKSSLVNRRHLIMGGAFCLAAGLAYARTPQVVFPAVEKEDFEKLIPERIGSWEFKTSSGVVLPPPDALSDRLYDNLVTRVYSAPEDPPIMFLTAYSNTQDGVLQVHRPEICYPAGGYNLTPTRPVSIENGVGGNIAANAFTATGRDRTEHVLYWTRVGNQFPLTWSQQRLAVVRANLEGVIPDGVLVRASLIAPTMEEAMPHLSKFAAQLNQNMNDQGRALLSGIKSNG